VQVRSVITASNSVSRSFAILNWAAPSNSTYVVDNFEFRPCKTNGLTYEWQKDGAVITNQTSATLSLTNLQTNQAGSYRVVVSSTYGSVTSDVAALTIGSAPVITSATNASGVVGQFFNMSISATNSPTSLTVVPATNLPTGLTFYGSPTNAIVGTPSNAVIRSLSVIASNGFGSTTGSLTITIAKGSPAISSWPTASAITFGQALSNSVLSGGVANPTGSFTWTTPTNKPNAGTGLQGVTFTPLATGDYNTASNTVSLTVNKATPVITWSNPLVALIYPAPLSSTQLSASASVPGTLTYSPTNGTVLNVGTNTVVVNFTPVDTNNYNSVTITNTVVVNKASPVLTWTPSPAAGLTYAAPLSSIQLNASSSVAGTFIYNPTNGAVLNAGTNTLVATFTPTDSTNYTSGLTITNTVVVGKATPTITWTNPAAIAYGTALSATQLNATSSVAGTFSYNPTNGSVLNAGTNTLTAVFTASNTTNYVSPVTNTVSLVVNKASPVLTWTPSPAAGLTYPAPLSSTQLNATSTVAGTFSYNPTNGTVLGAGTNTLVATFTPANTMNYASGLTITNTVVVAKGTPTISATPTASPINYGQALSSSTLSGGAINEDWVVSTFAGNGTYGYADGVSTSAKFSQPLGVAIDSSGNVYVADYAGHRIRKVSTAGVVSTLAGSGTNGYADGDGTAAQFICLRVLR